MTSLNAEQDRQQYALSIPDCAAVSFSFVYVCNQSVKCHPISLTEFVSVLDTLKFILLFELVFTKQL